MLKVNIPGHGECHLRWLVCDYNGTLAHDGILIPEIVPLLKELSDDLEIHVVTADTFGIAEEQCAPLPVKLTILPPDHQAQSKLDYITQLGPQSSVCLGNGRNDMLMLRHATLGICVMEQEGACVHSLQESDIVCRSAKDALGLLLNPKRLMATLRK